jgi:hypothetical protein
VQTQQLRFYIRLLRLNINLRGKSVMNKKWIATILIFALIIIAVVAILNLQSGGFEKELMFAEFLEMSPSEQQAYMESYEDVMDFLEWYRNAEEEYKAEQPNYEIGDGDINIEDYIK